jgi:hypothetical protein
MAVSIDIDGGRSADGLAKEDAELDKPYILQYF